METAKAFKRDESVPHSIEFRRFKHEILGDQFLKILRNFERSEAFIFLDAREEAFCFLSECHEPR